MNWGKVNHVVTNPGEWQWLLSIPIIAGLAFCGVLVWAISADSETNHHFRARCDKIPHSYAIISNNDLDKCLVPINGKIVVKFKQHSS